ncbi:DUF397 domain-containing protein [Gandjariella thermophila]|uniref:DUF397 domain-containing protein n=1 Tax=Gandjariella thermophila TaxID=1931992 RepID=A0A4D4JES0_9PSEU|nr:DUF397 domain-containing protein [Gandjariella thermophila]GDY32819.1 hypothetical protein GTS_44520 [Gandjariella thermophila]
MSTVDVARAKWRKSSRSNNGGNCVEVAFGGTEVAVRDSKNPGGAVLIFGRGQWDAFLAGVKHRRG